MKVKSSIVLFVIISVAAGMIATPVAAQGLVADLSAEGDTTVAPGETFELTYTLSNDGDTDASSAGLDVSPPDGITVADVSGDGSSSPSRFFLSGIGAGDSRTVTYTFQASENLSTGSVDIGMNGTLNTDSDATTDTATRTIDVQEPAPKTALSVDAPSVVSTGDTFDVEYTVSNTGDATSTAGGLNLTLPDELSVESVSGAGTNEPDRFFVDAIAPGESVSVTYSLTADADAQPGNVSIGVNATLSDSATSSSAEQSTAIELEKDLSVSDAAAGSDRKVGFTDTIKVINAFNSGDSLSGLDVSFTDVIEVINRFNLGG
jgi:hypothetical protein